MAHSGTLLGKNISNPLDGGSPGLHFVLTHKLITVMRAPNKKGKADLSSLFIFFELLLPLDHAPTTTRESQQLMIRTPVSVFALSRTSTIKARSSCRLTWALRWNRYEAAGSQTCARIRASRSGVQVTIGDGRSVVLWDQSKRVCSPLWAQ